MPIAGLLLIVAALIDSFIGNYPRATFSLVLGIWLLDTEVSETVPK
jgi:hypothetical protein